MASTHLTDQEWAAIGLQIGQERGTLDRLTGQRQAPEDLWLPTGVPEPYVNALRQGYVDALTGQSQGL